MRFIFGVIIGIALTIGTFYVHDSRVATASENNPGVNPPAAVGDGEIVNWDVLGRVTRDQIALLREQFNRLVGSR
jgi:hypothetical protein